MKLLLGFLICLFCTTASMASEIEWRTDLQTALEESILERKPLFITFFTDWCGWCKKLDRTTFRDPRVLDQIADFYVPVRINADRQKGIAAMFQVKAFPTSILLTRQAEEIGKIVGYRDPQGFSNFLLVGLQNRETQYSTLQKRLARSPQDPQLLYAWGDILLALDRHRDAGEVFRTILDLPDEVALDWKADAQLDLALTLLESPGSEDAVEALRNFIEDHPQSDRIHYAYLRLGKALTALGHPQEAGEMLTRASREAREEYIRVQARALLDP